MQEFVAQIWSFIGFLTLLQNFLPHHLREILMQWWSSLDAYFHPPQYTLQVPEFKGNNGLNANELYENIELYLESLDAVARTRNLTVFRAKKSSHLGFSPAPNQVMEDSFHGVRVWWTHEISKPESGGGGGRCRDEEKLFLLRMAKADKKFLTAYFNHIAEQAAEIEARNKEMTLYKIATPADGYYEGGWTGIPFKHPSSFHTLALHPLLKQNIVDDLDRFKRGKEFHRRIGRAWKRGYLLYGPPGTGKSSLIAAIANYMKYDVYDLELTQVISNTELRSLLIHTKEKSIIVIEDIDCSLDLSDRASRPPPSSSEGDADVDKMKSRVTLSGLLNFTDGLWSCCGEERIIIFTTNHKENLDPALLRCGRMDMHILLSFCSFPAFKSLALNYLEIADHALFSAVQSRMESGAEMTPAEIIEILMAKADDAGEALEAVIAALDAKRKQE